MKPQVFTMTMSAASTGAMCAPAAVRLPSRRSVSTVFLSQPSVMIPTRRFVAATDNTEPAPGTGAGWDDRTGSDLRVAAGFMKRFSSALDNACAGRRHEPEHVVCNGRVHFDIVQFEPPYVAVLLRNLESARQCILFIDPHLQLLVAHWRARNHGQHECTASAHGLLSVQRRSEPLHGIAQKLRLQVHAARSGRRCRGADDLFGVHTRIEHPE